MFPPVSLYKGFKHFSGVSEEHTEGELSNTGSLYFMKSVSLILFVVVPGGGVPEVVSA